jgi:hypothetical protein
MEAVVVIEEEIFLASDQLWRREIVAFGLNIELWPMQLHTNSIW